MQFVADGTENFLHLMSVSGVKSRYEGEFPKRAAGVAALPRALMV